MKRNMIIAASLAAAGVAAYLIRRSRNQSTTESNGQDQLPTKHITKVFSRAKQHSATH